MTALRPATDSVGTAKTAPPLMARATRVREQRPGQAERLRQLLSALNAKGGAGRRRWLPAAESPHALPYANRQQRWWKGATALPGCPSER